jgi:hypothetical protein
VSYYSFVDRELLMLIFLGLLILILVPLLMTGLQRLQPRIGYQWLLGVVGGVSAWLLIVISQPMNPRFFQIVTWKPVIHFPISPALLVDHISWPYAVAVLTLPLVALLTDVARVTEIKVDRWTAYFYLTAAGLFAVLAANPLTLILAWGVIDLIELFLGLRNASSSRTRERAVIAFSIRVAGIFFLLMAGIPGKTLGINTDFNSASLEVSGFLVIAAGFRLGVLPPHQSYLIESGFGRGLSNTRSLVPAASCLMLLARAAIIGVPQAWAPYLIIFTVLAMLIGGLAWTIARDELDGRPFWKLGMASLSQIAAILSLPSASIAWGLALLFSGSILFLTSVRDRRILPFMIVGLAGFSALPFTPAWEGITIFGVDGSLWLSILYFISLVLFFLGYLQHVLQSIETQASMERWAWVVYSFGLFLMVVTQWGIEWKNLLSASYFVGVWWLGLVAIITSIGIIYLMRRQPMISERFTQMGRGLLSLDWFYLFLWGVYRNLSRVINWINTILEGEGGVLWALLVLILIIAFLSQGFGG